MDFRSQEPPVDDTELGAAAFSRSMKGDPPQKGKMLRNSEVFIHLFSKNLIPMTRLQ
jgi:hypothetical protein